MSGCGRRGYGCSLIAGVVVVTVVVALSLPWENAEGRSRQLRERSAFMILAIPIVVFPETCNGLYIGRMLCYGAREVSHHNSKAYRQLTE